MQRQGCKQNKIKLKKTNKQNKLKNNDELQQIIGTEELSLAVQGLTCLHLITRSVGLALLSDILESGREQSRRGLGKGGALSSVKGRDCGVGSSGRRRQYARLLGAFLAAVVASLGGVSVLSRTGEACCCACGDFGGG